MGTTTTPQVKSLSEQRDEKIAAYTAEAERHEAAKAKDDKKAAGSASAKMSNRSGEIRQLEVEMELEGVTYVPWTKPRSSNGSGGSKSSYDKAVAEDNLAKLGKAFKTTKYETTKTTIDQRITAILKQAEKQGDKLKDPRKS